MAKKDGRGGKREGAGRPTDHDAKEAKNMARQSIIDKFGSLSAYFDHALTKAKEDNNHSFNYFKTVLEYAFGKPKDSLDITSGDEPIQNFNLSSLTEKELSVILKLHEGQSTDTNEE